MRHCKILTSRIQVSFLALFFLAGCATAPQRGTGDLGVVIERATGSIQVVETTNRSKLGQIAGLGDLSHASLNYSRDARYAYVFGRDGGLTKVDMLEMRIVKRVMQSGNSIGGAISQDGKLIAPRQIRTGKQHRQNADPEKPQRIVPHFLRLLPFRTGRTGVKFSGYD